MLAKLSIATLGMILHDLNVYLDEIEGYVAMEVADVTERESTRAEIADVWGVIADKSDARA